MADDYFDLGTYSRPVTTTSPQAQLWFDRGLVWTYGFNHEEGARCFERAAEADPGCAMAQWGIAYALGPNYNKPWEFFDEEDLRTTVERTHEALQRAEELAAGASPVERELISALRHRYPVDAATDASVWNKEYAAAMGRAYTAYPEDLDVATLYADALMMLTPWELWDLRTGEPRPGSRAPEAAEVLDRVVGTDAGREHPGALHFYTHLWEMSPTPERALTVADRLRDLVPDAGHLQHMPTTSTSSAATTARSSPPTGPRSGPTSASSPSAVRSTSTPSTARTTCTSSSTARCSAGSRRSRWSPSRRSRPRSPRSCCAWSRRRWRTGSRASCRCGCTR